MSEANGPGEAGPDSQPARSETAPVRRPQSASEVGAAFQTHMRAARSDFESQVAHARAEFDEANARIKQRTGRDLILAIGIGLALGAGVLASLLFVKWIFLIFAIAAVGMAVFEFSRALQGAERRVDLIPQVVVGVLLMVSGYFSTMWLHWIATIAAVALVVVWRLMAQMIARDGRTYGAVLSDILVAAFVQLYVPFLGSLAMVLLAQDGGEWWVMAFLVLAVVADTGAYVSGLTFGRGGRHPMAPRISPNKTWEGFAGAAVAALAAGALLALYMLGLPWWAGLIFGAIILGTATAGDLGESMIKRDLGIKDMSSWIPGHGGLLDRLDSVLPSGVVALALYILLTPLVAA